MNNDWTSGYVADVGYTHGYTAELNPVRLKLALLNLGLDCPSIKNACELGFGHGVSVNIHAASSEIQWYGNDFNPSQANIASKLSEISGAHLSDESFVDFCRRDDLPDFEYIGLHGIWSWINDENRSTIVDFVRRKLRLGGILYISYNSQPGWASMIPVRDLLNEFCDVMGRRGDGRIKQIEDAVEFADQLMNLEPNFIKHNPQIKVRIEKIKQHNKNYVAHEYFNRDWHPMSFTKVSNWLSPAKLSYACSANYLDNVDIINLTGPQLEFLRKIPDPMFRQSVQDFMTNIQFRRDYWVKGPVKLSKMDQLDGVRSTRLMLVTGRADVSTIAKGALGESTINKHISDVVCDVLSGHSAKSIGEIEEECAKFGLGLNKLIPVLFMLIGNSTIVSVQDASTQVLERSRKFNLSIINNSINSNDIHHLSSPLTGGGVNVIRFHQLFLLAKEKGIDSPAKAATFVWEIMKMQGQKLLLEGKVIERDEDNLKELSSQAESFFLKSYPLIKSLKMM